MRKTCVTYVSLCFLAACLMGSVASICAASQPVVIGVPVPLSGQLEAFGQMMKNAFEMAVEDVNRAGDIHGRSVELRFADDRGDAARVDDAYRRMASAGAVMLVGGYASDATYRMARMAESGDLPFLVCTASADKITQRGWTNIYRLNPPISEYTQGLEDFWIKNFKPKSMAILHEDSMFGTEGALRMMEFCREQAIEIITHIGYDRVTLTPARLRSRLAPLTFEPPDVIYMISYFEDALMLVKSIKALGIDSMLCGGGGGFTLAAFAQAAGADADLLLTAALWSDQVDTLDNGSFHKRYAQRFGHKADYHGAEAYSALMVAAEALRTAKSFAPHDIRQALNCIYMKTPFGPVKFYSHEDFERQNNIHTLVLQIINGRYETVWPPDKASAGFILPKRD
ncbi:Branched-chain ABC-type amino acid transporter, substrate-binding protein [Desulfosarcina cetonica]|uniref:ABC transporter substrate-binding protein n=1 Tax=Desulfosarcina cetonica TaxID=90730 RepID=UPI0006D23301|nr:ABC transporter substrate-binding protein [Desulfosarcina cetonica]VTR68831.1 Branched-chain ABC-type amino acid transporter, substrate-binding protein [Desulfosarcina cetonica]